MERYETLKTVGKGAFGKCLLVRHRTTGKQFVMKQVRMPGTPDEKAECLQEATLMTRLNHANVVDCEDCFFHGNQLVIVMEFARGGDLEKVMRRHKSRGAAMAEGIIVDIIAQLALSLEYLHSRKHPILHRDIKAANVFLVPVDQPTSADGPRFRFKLGDFGVSRVLEASRVLAKTTCGTPFFMAPELFRGVPYSAKADVWSLGILAYELMSLRLPFEAKSMGQLGDAVCRKDPPALPNRYSPALRELVMGMLTKDAERRISAADAVRSPALRQRCADLLAEARISTGTTSSAFSSASSASSAASSPVPTRVLGARGASPREVDAARAAGVKLPRLVSNVIGPRMSAPAEVMVPSDVLREPEPLPGRRPHRRISAPSASSSRLPTPLTEDQRRVAIAHFIDEQATRMGLSTGPLREDAVQEERMPLPPVMRASPTPYGHQRPNYIPVPSRPQAAQRVNAAAPHYPPTLEGGPPRVVKAAFVGDVEARGRCLEKQFAPASVAEPAVQQQQRPLSHRDNMQKAVNLQCERMRDDVRNRQVRPEFAAVREPLCGRPPVSPSAGNFAGKAAQRAVPFSSRPIWLQGPTKPVAPSRAQPRQNAGGDLGQLLAANAKGAYAERAAGVRSGWKYGNVGGGVAEAFNMGGRPRSRIISAF